jgi:hypothetical protein
MTGAEKTEYKAVFPNLDVDKAVVTGENSGVYNCLAWTLGITTSWVWPGENESDFDTLYLGNGFKRAANGPVAALGTFKIENEARLHLRAGPWAPLGIQMRRGAPYPAWSDRT